MFFDGLIDPGAILGELEDLFPLRVQIGALASGTSKTGGLIPGAFSAAPGLDSIPAQRSDAKGGQIANNKTVSHEWTLPGVGYSIKAGQVLVEIANGDRYEILLADRHCFGLHTDLKTLKVTQ